MTTTPSDPARACLEAARTAHDALRDAYADPQRPPTTGTAAALNQSIKFGLKAAEVEALLGIRDVLLANAPRFEEFTARLRTIHHPSCAARDGGECLGCRPLGGTAGKPARAPWETA